MLKQKQLGAALLIIITFIVLAAMTLFLVKLNSDNFQIEDQAQTARALNQAKEALIGFAASYAKTHPGQPLGYLPCPDHDGDGSSSACGTTGYSVIGRFPWRTLGLPPLRDGTGECLWYAVSGAYKDNPKSTLTSDMDGAFIIKDSSSNTIIGSSARNRAIAVVFAPSFPLSGQQRTPNNSTECGDNVKVIDYLDSLDNINNATGDRDVADTSNNDVFKERTSIATNFWVTSSASDTPTFVNASMTKSGGNTGEIIFNDSLVWITPTDFAPVYKRMDFWVAEKVTGCLEEYVENENYRKHFLEIAYNSSGNGGFLEAIGDKTNPANNTYRDKVADSIGSSSVESCNAVCNSAAHTCQQNCPEGNGHGDCVSACEHTKQDCRTACESSGSGTIDNTNTIDIEEKFPWAIPADQTSGGNLSFVINSNTYFGRIPSSPTSTTQNNGMLPTWPKDPQNNPAITYPCGNPVCFNITQSTTGCSGVADKDGYWWWWDKWQELVFYGIDNKYSPDTTTYFWVESTKQNTETQAAFEARERQRKENTMARIKTPVGPSLQANEWEFVSDINPHQSVPNPHPPTPTLRLNTNPAKFVVIVAGRRLNTQNRDVIADKTTLSNYLENQNVTPNDNTFEKNSITSTFNDIACRNESNDCQLP